MSDLHTDKRGANTRTLAITQNITVDGSTLSGRTPKLSPGDPVEEFRTLKEAPGQDIVVTGNINWWLDHPEIAADEVAGWLLALGGTAVTDG